MPTFTIGQLFKSVEIAKAHDIYVNDRDNFHKRVRDEIVAPNLDRINKVSGQENNASYLAYALEHLFNTHPDIGPEN